MDTGAWSGRPCLSGLRSPEIGGSAQAAERRLDLFLNLPPASPGGTGGAKSPLGDLGVRKKAVKLAQLGGVWGGSPIAIEQCCGVELSEIEIGNRS